MHHPFVKSFLNVSDLVRMRKINNEEMQGKKGMEKEKG